MTDSLFVPGQTCWRVDHADRYACIVDAADYFRHAKSAMLRARRRIIMIGWDFDLRIKLQPDGKTLPGPNRMDLFLFTLMRRRPDLEIYVLTWQFGVGADVRGIQRGMTPVYMWDWVTGKRMRFAVDNAHPTGAAHHQKIVVVDDVVAFCGGIDLTVSRWDTTEHADGNRFRKDPNGEPFRARHDVVAAVDGAAARALGEQARLRWKAATEEELDPIEDAVGIWPSDLEPTMHDVDVALARTIPMLGDTTEVREIEQLYLEAFAAARQVIYIENQYLASRTLADALAARLKEADGPEIVVVIPRNAEDRIEQQAMDGARHKLLQMLWAADLHERLAVYWPVTAKDAPIIVHAKVLVVDDRLLRIGSSNLNNRSMGFDTECDVAVEALDDDEKRQTIRSVRNRLISEHLDVSTDEFEGAVDDAGSFLAAVDALRGQGRTLHKFDRDAIADEASPLAETDVLDPSHAHESMTKRLTRLLIQRRIVG